MDADFNLSMAYHIFGSKAFLDPFVEGGDDLKFILGLKMFL